MNLKQQRYRLFSHIMWGKKKRDYRNKYLRSKIQTNHEVSIIINLSANQLNIAFVLDGGVGDYLLSCNFIYCLLEKLALKNVRVDIWEHGVHNIAEHVIGKYPNVSHIYQGFPPNNYDVILLSIRIPVVHKFNKSKVLFFSVELFHFLQSYEECMAMKESFVRFHPRLDGGLASYDIMLGYKRYNQLDYKHLLGIGERYALPIPMKILNNVSNELVLKLLQGNRQFITIHSGVDARNNNRSTKEWPTLYYNELLYLIKREWPRLLVVQLGIQRDPKLEYVDVSLLGQTSLEETKLVLKKSAIHIDIEGGLVHLRHALNGGPSLVLFGPTSPDFYGYSENINMYAKGFQCTCEWVHNNWNRYCLRTNSDNSYCMALLTPNLVFKEFKELYEKTKK